MGFAYSLGINSHSAARCEDPAHPDWSAHPIHSSQLTQAVHNRLSGISFPGSYFSFQNQLAVSAVTTQPRMKLSCKPFSSLINKKEEHQSTKKATFADFSWFLTSIKAETLQFSCIMPCLPAVKTSHYNTQNQVDQKPAFFQLPRHGSTETLLSELR